LGLINASFGKNGETDTSINNTIIKIKKITEKNDKKLTFIILNSERAENSKKGRDKNQYILPNYSTVSGRPASEILRGCAYRGPKNESIPV